MFIPCNVIEVGGVRLQRQTSCSEGDPNTAAGRLETFVRTESSPSRGLSEGVPFSLVPARCDLIHYVENGIPEDRSVALGAVG